MTGPAGGVVAGATNSIADVEGITVGHDTLRGPGQLTGVTVVLAPNDGAVGGIDVRGGGPGTRESDLLDPRNVVERVHAVCLSGGSAFGLAAADGVMAGLFDDGVGLPMGGPGEVVPIVPAAVVFDLGRGGDFAYRPGPDSGRRAYSAARAARDSGRRPATGVVGAGTGAKAGGFKGGVGTASAVLGDGTRLGVLLVLNAVGEVVDPATGEILGARALLPGEGSGLRAPDAGEVAAAREHAAQAPSPALGRPGMATTIGVVATDVTLTKAQCAKLAGVAHDGLARAVDPVHTMLDGDTFFGLSTTSRPAPDLAGVHELLTVAARCVTRAVVHAVLAAESLEAPGGSWRGYREAFPSAWSGRSPGPPRHPGPRSSGSD